MGISAFSKEDWEFARVATKPLNKINNLTPKDRGDLFLDALYETKGLPLNNPWSSADRKRVLAALSASSTYLRARLGGACDVKIAGELGAEYSAVLHRYNRLLSRPVVAPPRSNTGFKIIELEEKVNH